MFPGCDLSQGSPSFSPARVVSRNFTTARCGDNSNFSTVHGNQHNHYTIQEKTRVTRYIVDTEEEEAEYEQFPEVLRSAVIAFRSVHCGAGQRYDEKQREWVDCGKQTVVAGEVVIGGVGLKCTAVSYSGEKAQERWKEDFRQFGGTRSPENVQLVAINRSSIPMHVFLGDLVPVAHLKDQVGGIGELYLAALAAQDDASLTLWLDTSRGVFCRGPRGPECDILYWSAHDLPLDAQLLQEDIMIRYLSGRKLDCQALGLLSWSWHREASRIKLGRATVISTRTNTILAIASAVWRDLEYREGSLSEREILPGGVTRFTLFHNRCRLSLYLDNWHEVLYAWTAQALSIFHAHGVLLEGDLCEYKLILPEEMKGMLSSSKAKRRRRKRLPPVYLFVPPFPTSTFWSFDPNNQIPISHELCHYLGLPIKLSLQCYEYSWETSIYQHLRNYQIARDFDPTTTDFAQHVKYPLYDVLKGLLPDRFIELNDSETTEHSPPSSTSFTRPLPSEDGHQAGLEDMSLRLLFGDTPFEDIGGICSTSVATPTFYKGSSSNDIRRNSSCLAQSGQLSPSFSDSAPRRSKARGSSSLPQAVRRTASGSKPTPKPFAPRPHSSSTDLAKPTPGAKTTGVAARGVVPPARNSTLPNSVKNGTKVPSVNRVTTRSPMCGIGSTAKFKTERSKEAREAASQALPDVPRKPASLTSRTFSVTTGSLTTSASTVERSTPSSSRTSHPSRASVATKNRTTRINLSVAATSQPAPPARHWVSLGTASSNPTTSRTDVARTAPSSTPCPSTPRTAPKNKVDAFATSSEVKTKAGTASERKLESRGVQERVKMSRRATMTTTIKEPSGLYGLPPRASVAAPSSQPRSLIQRSCE